MAAPIYLTDYLSCPVLILAGEHIVELRYESWTLRVGMEISLVTSVALVALASAVVVQRWR